MSSRMGTLWMKKILITGFQLLFTNDMLNIHPFLATESLSVLVDFCLLSQSRLTVD